MKRLGFIIVILIMLVSLTACSSSVTGKYMNVDGDGSYIELKSDGVFYVQEGNNGVSGKYNVEDGVITFILGNGMAAKGKFQDNTLIDPDGEKWVKK